MSAVSKLMQVICFPNILVFHFNLMNTSRSSSSSTFTLSMICTYPTTKEQEETKWVLRPCYKLITLINLSTKCTNLQTAYAKWPVHLCFAFFLQSSAGLCGGIHHGHSLDVYSSLGFTTQWCHSAVATAYKKYNSTISM